MCKSISGPLRTIPSSTQSVDWRSLHALAQRRCLMLQTTCGGSSRRSQSSVSSAVNHSLSLLPAAASHDLRCGGARGFVVLSRAFLAVFQATCPSTSRSSPSFRGKVSCCQCLPAALSGCGSLLADVLTWRARPFLCLFSRRAEPARHQQAGAGDRVQRRPCTHSRGLLRTTIASAREARDRVVRLLPTGFRA
jgi:hypothetical protein